MKTVSDLIETLREYNHVKQAVEEARFTWMSKGGVTDKEVNGVLQVTPEYAAFLDADQILTELLNRPLED